jgi:hypothetical protein
MQIAKCKLQNADCKMQIAKCKLQIAEWIAVSAASTAGNRSSIPICGAVTTD